LDNVKLSGKDYSQVNLDDRYIQAVFTLSDQKLTVITMLWAKQREEEMLSNIYTRLYLLQMQSELQRREDFDIQLSGIVDKKGHHRYYNALAMVAQNKDAQSSKSAIKSTNADKDHDEDDQSSEVPEKNFNKFRRNN
jgi:hypothetical protein